MACAAPETNNPTKALLPCLGAMRDEDNDHDALPPPSSTGTARRSGGTSSAFYSENKGVDLLLSLAETATAAEATTPGGFNNNPITPSPPTMGDGSSTATASQTSHGEVGIAAAMNPMMTNDERQVVMSLHSVRNTIYASPIKVSAKNRAIGAANRIIQQQQGLVSPPQESDTNRSAASNSNKRPHWDHHQHGGRDGVSSASAFESSSTSRNVRSRNGQQEEVQEGSQSDRVISPASSNGEKAADNNNNNNDDPGGHEEEGSPGAAGGDDEEEEEETESGGAYSNTNTPGAGSYLPPPHHYPPAYGPYGGHASYYQPPPHQRGYYPTPPLYYHHHNPAIAAGSPAGVAMYSGAPAPPPGYGMYPPPYPQQPGEVVQPATAVSAIKVKSHQSSSKQQNDDDNSDGQHSPSSANSAEWKQAYHHHASADGAAPFGDDGSAPPFSANRCVPRKHLFPPNNWQDQLAMADGLRVPDFHRLVNFPDFLTRGRSGGLNCHNNHNAEVNGRKHCVMCGKLRVCSSSGGAAGSRSAGRKSGSGGGSKSDGSETAHIIPRQNKGVCTACDVAVWVVVDVEGLEIKWCKGCKNFRPWPSFGSKVLATKCVRCRDRQKEKYASQKRSNKKDDNAVMAANNLANLMHHAASQK